MDFLNARKNMVEGQLTPNKIVNKELISRFLTIPREFFVGKAFKHVSYADGPTPLNEQREIFPPLVLAHMLQALELNESDNLLVVAAGSGYAASVASGLVNSVYGVEDDESLLALGAAALEEVSCKTVTLCEGKPEQGLEEKGKFTKIVIDAPVEVVPFGLFEQLEVDGKLVAVVRGVEGVSKLKCYTKNAKKINEETLREVQNMKVHSAFKRVKEFVL